MPYRPIATFEQVYAYDPQDAATHTASPLVNAVADALHTTKLIECKEIARHLEVDERKLSNALELELGLNLKELMDRYRIKQILDYITDNPDYTTEQLAEAIGYTSVPGITRFMYTKLGLTPCGRQAHRGPDRSAEMLKKIRAIKNSNLPFAEMIQALKDLH